MHTLTAEKGCACKTLSPKIISSLWLIMIKLVKAILQKLTATCIYGMFFYFDSIRICIQFWVTKNHVGLLDQTSEQTTKYWRPLAKWNSNKTKSRRTKLQKPHLKKFGGLFDSGIFILYYSLLHSLTGIELKEVIWLFRIQFDTYSTF